MVNRRNVNTHKRRATGSFFRQFLVGFLLLLLLLLVGGATWYGTRLEPLTIVSVQVEGGDTVNHVEVKSVAERELEGSYYNLVPKRFAWLYPEEKISAEVKKIEKIKNVALSRPDGQTILITIEEYQPSALWCATKDSYENCTFIDAEGYAFTMAPPLTGTAMLRFINDQSPTVGQKPFTRDFIKDTIYFARSLRQDLNFYVSSVEKIGPEEATFDLQGGGQVKITLRQPAEESLDNLLILLASDDFSHIQPANFEYIDLRFGDKVFVNEHSGEPDEEVEAATEEVVEE